MPTYIVTAPSGRLSPEDKSKLAGMITDTHANVTGARASFTQVIFRDIEAGDIFQGGKALAGEMLFVQGHVRAGLGALSRGALIRAMVPGAMAILRMPRHAIWIYLAEMPARAMAEYGHILPEPGREDDWLAALSAEERARVEGRS